MSAELAGATWVYQTGPYRALGYDFAVRSTHLAVGQYLDRVLRPLARPGEPAAVYSAVHDPGGDQGYALFIDATRLLEAPTAAGLCRALLGHVNQEAVRQTPSHVVLHASAAEWRGRGLLFPARSESGKTTLVAGLVRAGFGYYTDEAAAIDPVSLMLLPYPKALSIDAGSWGVLADLKPKLPRELRPFLDRQWHVDPEAIRPDAIARPARPAAVIAPRFVRGARTHIKRVSRAETLKCLIEGSFNIRVHGRAGFEALAELVRGSACHELVMGDLEEAVRLVRDVADHLV